MYKNEGAFRSALVKEFIQTGALARPIETGAVAMGIADVYFCYELASWLELKREHCNGPNWNRAIDFRPGQFPFLKKNQKKGGHSFVGIAYDNGSLFIGIKDVDEETRRPINRSYLFLPDIRGRGKIILDWFITFEKM